MKPKPSQGRAWHTAPFRGVDDLARASDRLGRLARKHLLAAVWDPTRCQQIKL